MNHSSILYRLQEIDTQLDQAHNRLNEIEKILNDISELQQAQESFEASNNRFIEQENNFQKAEQAIRELKLKIEQTESKLYGGKIHNPKELQDLQHESAALKRHLQVLEDRELEIMLILEEIEVDLSSARQHLTEVQSRLETQSSLLNGERISITEKINRLEMDRQVVANMIDNHEIAIYEQLRINRRGIAVATSIDKSCSACGSPLSPALVQSALTSPSLVRCPTCGRIIYAG